MVAVKVIGVFIIVFIGFLACKLGWLPVKSAIYLSKIVLFIACPCVLFLAIARQTYSMENIHTMLLLLAVSAVLYVLSYLIGFLFCRIFRVPREDAAMYVNFSAVPNNGFIGIPVSLALFGQPILFMIALMNMVQAFSLYSFGTYLLRSNARKAARANCGSDAECGEKGGRGDAEQDAGSTVAKPVARMDIKQILKDFFIPPVLGGIAGMVFYLFRIPVPGGVADVLEAVGSMMTPLCMMFIGIQLTESSPRRLFANKRLIAAALFRLVLIPALFFVILLPLWNGSLPIRIDALFLCAVMINFMTPIGAALPPLAEMYGSNAKLASEGVFLSTLLSMITIPVASIFLVAL
jgi:predicted permease